MKKSQGFTLIEVLLALAVIAIALTALLRSISANIASTERIKSKTISHWVGMQGVAMIQLGLIPITSAQEVTEKTEFLGQTWYWRVRVTPTPIKNMDQITIKVSRNQTGPFVDPIYAFRSKL